MEYQGVLSPSKYYWQKRFQSLVFVFGLRESNNFDFSLMSSSHVLAQIFNLKGHLIDKLIDKKLTSGVHSLKWDATEKSAGVYFVRISTKQSDNIQKIIYLK